MRPCFSLPSFLTFRSFRAWLGEDRGFNGRLLGSSAAGLASIAFWETQIEPVQPKAGGDQRDTATFGQHEKSMAYIEGVRAALAKFSSQQNGIFNDATERAARTRMWEIGGFGILSILAIGF